jgi:serine/threonine-protein kinase
LLREGFQHGSLARRFAEERRTLAALNHPHIARLLDGGETDAGVPWLVMEFVDGENLLEAADRRGLDLRARVRLMLPVCAALQHAHQRLIVHRDLKPGNILVRADGEPILLDFGIAKLLDPLHDAPEITQAAFAAMTPDYASPEQARGEPVGTASDLWSLGVVLYRLLGGMKPYEFGAISRFDLAQRLSTLQIPPLRLRVPGFPADLDAILGLCLRAEAERRYPSALALEEDLVRFLRGQPVRAHPDSFAYRASRFLRRNWAASTLGAAALVAAAAGTGGIVWQRNLAIRRAETAQRVTAFLVGLFKAPDPWATGLGDQSLERILLEGRRELVDGLQDEPEIRRELLTALGEVFRNLGAEEDAIAILDQAIAAQPDLRRRDPQRWADIAFLLGVAQFRTGALAEAEGSLRAVLAVRRAARRGDDEKSASALNTLGAVLAAQRRDAEARDLYAEALAMRERLLGSGHKDVATTLQNQAALALNAGDTEAAVRDFRRAADIMQRAFPDGHPDRATTLNNLGMALHASGLDVEAESLIRKALAMRERLLPADHPFVAGSLNNLGIIFYDQERWEDAATTFRAALAGVAGRASEDHPLVVQIRENLAAAEQEI